MEPNTRFFHCILRNCFKSCRNEGVKIADSKPAPIPIHQRSQQLGQRMSVPPDKDNTFLHPSMRWNPSLRFSDVPVSPSVLQNKNNQRYNTPYAIFNSTFFHIGVIFKPGRNFISSKLVAYLLSPTPRTAIPAPIAGFPMGSQNIPKEKACGTGAGTNHKTVVGQTKKPLKQNEKNIFHEEIPDVSFRPSFPGIPCLDPSSSTAKRELRAHQDLGAGFHRQRKR